MRRLQLIELEDEPWFPPGLRDLMTEYLQFMIEATRPYAVVLPRLRAALERTGARRIVDLCSGGGGPWQSLYSALRENLAVDLCLTDAYPNRPAFERLKAAVPGIDACFDPVDAARVPPELAGFRTLFSALHHFRPEQVRAILADTVARGEGIAVFEATQRSPAAVTAALLLIPLMVLLTSPFIRPFRLSRLLWTYLLPVLPLAITFDGLISCLRTYTPAELEALVDGVPGAERYEWEIGAQKAERAPLPVTYLVGCPAQATESQRPTLPTAPPAEPGDSGR
jgi:hypothetical protein